MKHKWIVRTIKQIITASILTVTYVVNAEQIDISTSENNYAHEEECDMALSSYESDYNRIVNAIENNNESEYRLAVYFMSLSDIVGNCKNVIGEDKYKEVARMVDLAIKINNGVNPGAFPNPEGKAYVYESPVSTTDMIAYVELMGDADNKTDKWDIVDEESIVYYRVEGSVNPTDEFGLYKIKNDCSTNVLYFSIDNQKLSSLIKEENILVIYSIGGRDYEETMEVINALNSPIRIASQASNVRFISKNPERSSYSLMKMFNGDYKTSIKLKAIKTNNATYSLKDVTFVTSKFSAANYYANKKCVNNSNKITGINSADGTYIARKLIEKIALDDLADIKLFLPNEITYWISGVEFRKTYKEFIDFIPYIFSDKERAILKSNIDNELQVYFPFSRLEGYTWDAGDIKFTFYASGVLESFSVDISVLPSFDCDKASQLDEVSICVNPVLAKLDMELSALYKDARRFLTGNEANKLLSDQRAFLAARKEIKSDVNMMQVLYKERIKTLERQLTHENKKSYSINDTAKSVLDNLNGQWISNRYYESGNCGKTGSFDTSGLQAIIAYPNVTLINKETSKKYTYKIASSETTSFNNVYHNSDAFKDPRSMWGTCGGALKLPYYSQYHFITLVQSGSTEYKEQIYMVYTSNKAGDESLIIDLWSDLNYAFDKEEGVSVSTERMPVLITDGYNMQR